MVVDECCCAPLTRCPLSTGSPFYYNQGGQAQSQGQSQAQGQAQAAHRVELGLGLGPLGGELEVKSPLAATRANSGASAASPTGSACMKQEAGAGLGTPGATPSAAATPTASPGHALAQGLLL